MPEIGEVIAKATTYLDYSIYKYASHLSREIKEDIKQTGYVRVLEAYERLKADQGWKAFIQTHCNGAVKDYIKKACSKKETFEMDEERDEIDGGFLLNFGIFYNSKDEVDLPIKWDLVSRMASKDDRVLLVARFILGHTVSDISRNSKMSRERISQKMQEFCEILEDPFMLEDAWVNQIIYAFGLSEHFHMVEHDNGEGWDLETVRIFENDLEYRKQVYSNQMDLI